MILRASRRGQLSGNDSGPVKASGEGRIMPRSVQGARRALLFSVCGVELQDETIDTVAQLRADERHPLRHPARDKSHVLAQAIQLRDDDDILRFRAQPAPTSGSGTVHRIRTFPVSTSTRNASDADLKFSAIPPRCCRHSAYAGRTVRPSLCLLRSDPRPPLHDHGDVL
jgi:hypothetical protein